MLAAPLVLALVSDPWALVDVHTSTAHVEQLAVDGERLWTATRGGVEAYAVDTGALVRRWDTRDGLDTAHAWTIAIDETGPMVRTTASECRLDGERFACVAVAGPPPMQPVVAPRRAGARVTAIVEVDGRRFEGTAGAGLWSIGESATRLTALDQPCSNHIGAMAVHGERLWLGSFHEGLCFTDDGRTFGSPSGADAPRMINDLIVVDGVLWIAATEGLFRTVDGTSLERDGSVRQRGVNGLARDGDAVLATTPGAVWRVPLSGGRTRAQPTPGGTRAIQGIVRTDDTTWLPTEDRGLLRLGDDGDVVRLDLAAGLPTSWVLAAAADDDGRIFAGSLRDGVTIVDLDGTHTSLPGLPDAWIFDVTRLDDAIAIGTQNGAALVSGDSVETLPDLPHPAVHAFARYRDHLWVATEGGLAVYRR